MRPRRSLLGWVIAGAVAVVAHAASGELVPLPPTPVDNLDPAVREQVEASRQRLDALIARLPAEPLDRLTDDLVAAYGDVGQLYLLYDRAEVARLAFENLLTLSPETFAAWYYLGVVHENAGRFDEAADVLRQALELRPDDLPTVLRLADAHFRLRQLDAAGDGYRRALTLDPSSAAAHFGLGRLADTRRDHATAVDHFERAIALQPEADAIYHPLALAQRRLGDLDAARAAIAQAGSSTPTFMDPLMGELKAKTTTARAYIVEGNQSRRRGRLDLALESYRRAVEVAPEDPAARYNLGAILGEIGRVDEAEAEFRAAVALDPQHRDAQFNLGIGLRARGRHAEALEHFAAALEVDPADLALRLEWGVTLIAAGRTAEGRAELETVRAAESRDADILLLLARYLAAAGDPAAADAELERAWTVLVRPEERARIRLRQAERALQRADRLTASTRFDEAVALAPDLAEARLARAGFLGRSGRFADAAADYAEAERLRPKDTSATAGHAVALGLIGRFAEARDVVLAGLDRMPEAIELADLLARLLATSPDPAVRDGARALALADRLVEVRPDAPSRETRAMALAASGRFADAAAIQQRLVDGAGRGAPPALVARLRSNLARYRGEQIALPPW